MWTYGPEFLTAVTVLTSASFLLSLRFVTEAVGDILTKLQAFTKLHDVTTQTTIIFKYFTQLRLTNFCQPDFYIVFMENFRWLFLPQEFSIKQISKDGK